MQVYTTDTKKEKKVKCGDLVDGVFTRNVTSKHYMRIMQGYGIQENVIEILKKLQCRKIVFRTPDGIYESYLNEWLAKDIRTKDFGHGEQRFMPLKRMRRIDG